MERSIALSIVAAANAETLTEVFTTPEAKSRKVTGIMVEETTGLTVRGYLDQDRVLELDMDTGSMEQGRIKCDIPVPVGVRLAMGFYNSTGGGITELINVFYEETE